jgi:hypothetical protein
MFAYDKHAAFALKHTKFIYTRGEHNKVAFCLQAASNRAPPGGACSFGEQGRVPAAKRGHYARAHPENQKDSGFRGGAGFGWG